MGARIVHQLNKPFFATYRHNAAPGFPLEGDLCDLAQILGFQKNALDGQGLAALIAPEYRSQLTQKLAALLETGNVELFVPLLGPDGMVRWFLNRGQTLQTENGNICVEGVLVEADNTFCQIAAEHEQMAHFREKLLQTENVVCSLRVRAEQDSLTGLFNNRTTRRLAEEYLQARENPCAIIIIDVDNFKRINDHYGHMAGDQALTGAAAAIKKLFRTNDIVGRIGGDEFLILMKDVVRREIVELRCQQIVQGFHDIACDLGPADTLSCSAGAVFSTTPGYSYDELFCCADRATYSSKESGGDQYCIEVLEQ